MTHNGESSFFGRMRVYFELRFKISIFAVKLADFNPEKIGQWEIYSQIINRYWISIYQ